MSQLEIFVVSNSQEEEFQSSHKVTKALQEHLDLKIKELTFLASMISEQMQTQEDITFDFLNLGLESKVFNDLYVIKPDGKGQSLRGIYADSSKQAYFEHGMNGKVYISPPFVSNFDGEQVVAYTVPIIANNQVKGVLCGRNTIKEVETFLLSGIYNEKINFYIVTPKGEVIASTNEIYPYLQEYIKIHPYIEAHDESRHVISDQQDSYELINDKNKLRHITYQRIHPLGDWFLVSAPNEDYIASFVQYAKQIIVLILTIFSLIIISINTYIAGMKKRNIKKIEGLAFNDGLTGLLNQNGFIMKANKVLKKRKDASCIFVLFDLDGFKLVNEIYGYTKGDQILKELAIELNQQFTRHTVHARLSNELFALLLRDYDASNLELIADKIREIVNRVCYRCIENNVEIHMGIYQCSTLKVDCKLAVDHADMARLHAKTLDSKYYYVFDEELWEYKKNLMMIQQDIKSALEHKEFQVFYQAKFDPNLDQAVCAEALVRWGHPQKGFISPATFIPIAEKSGEIIDIGRYVFEEVCKMLKDRTDKNLPNLPISINLSRVELYQLDLIGFLREILTKYQINPRLIEIEITETTALNDIEVINEKIKLIHDLGITVSMDDFGTGNSTFSNLKHVDIDVLKIDRSFLWDIEHNSKSKEMVHGIIDLAKRIGVLVVCEGVESIEQVEILKQMGCDLIQGYVYSKPIPRTEFEKIIS